MLPIAASERRVGEVFVVYKAIERFGVYWSSDPSLRAAPSGAAQRARGIAQAVTEPARWRGPLAKRWYRRLQNPRLNQAAGAQAKAE